MTLDEAGDEDLATPHTGASHETLRAEIARRRTFAIISHPDAGKTTLTEKLLLYGGAIHLAGSVKSRRADRHATSDWMAMEQERGISVTSSVMQFEYDGYVVNLLDTPGHEDFSEDTYRTLVAADSAVMLLDNRKGVEERTRQLFAVCKRRRTPIFTFVNKCDRAGADPLELISDVENDLGIMCHPITWPIFDTAEGSGGFVGVYDRRVHQVHLFERDEHRGARRAVVRVGALDSDEMRDVLGAGPHGRLVHDIALLDAAGHPFDLPAIIDGTLSPVFFGSALTNFGVEPFLREFLELAPSPGAREANVGMQPADQDAFTGFVFKIQANMDPRHRDRVAFVRIVSGHFEAGMQVQHTRSGKPIRLASPQTFMARERTAVTEAWPGDVVGIMDRGVLRIGDTLAEMDGVEFQGIPRFAPEHFARVSLLNPMKRKQLDAGLRQLTEEGAAQTFFTSATDVSGPTPIVGAVGQLQFDVMLHRLEHEYGVKTRLDRISARHPRWVTGDRAEIEKASREHGCTLLFDAKGQPLLLFEDQWGLRRALERAKNIAYHEVAP
ncbi:MAG: peptide chain release factor 3 [Cytophagaceae bacterium]|nr:peptide chain release factor 3 [Gemmatimonadaceae bacterium]